MYRQPELQPEPAFTTLLVVDDNHINRIVLVHMLRKHGYATATAEDGLEALEKFAKARYSGVLMDVQMPRMDGLEATVEIRRREGEGRRTPVIAVTASYSRESCMAASMDDYIEKPVSWAVLNDVLERWVPAHRE